MHLVSPDYAKTVYSGHPDRWWPEVAYAPVAAQRRPDGSKRVVWSLLSHQAMPGQLLAQIGRVHEDLEIAVEPPKEADWLGFDIDAQSIYKTVEAIARLVAEAESWGGSAFVCCTSMYPDGTPRGLRVYVLLGQRLTRYQRWALAAWWAHRVGMTTKGGVLELIPTRQTYVESGDIGCTQRFSVPFQNSTSCLLDDQLIPLPYRPDECLEIVAGMAAGADAGRVNEALGHAIAWSKHQRRFSAPKNRLEAVPKPIEVGMARHGSNWPLVKLAENFARRFRLIRDEDASLWAGAFREELRTHPDWNKISGDTRKDIGRTRARRLLKCAIRFIRGDRRKPAADASQVNHNTLKQQDTLTRLLDGLDEARKMFWSSGRELHWWLNKTCGIGRRWLMTERIRPLWEWLINTDDRQPSPEFHQAIAYLARAGVDPTTPSDPEDRKVCSDSEPPSLCVRVGSTSEQASDPAVEDPLPAWVEELQAAFDQRRDQWVEGRRKIRKREAAAARIQKRQERHDRTAEPVLVGDVMEETAAAAPAADANFMADMRRSQVQPTYTDQTSQERFAGDGWFQTQLAPRKGNAATRRGIVDIEALEAQLKADLKPRTDQPQAIATPAAPPSPAPEPTPQPAPPPAEPMSPMARKMAARRAAVEAASAPVSAEQIQQAEDVILAASSRGWFPDAVAYVFRHVSLPGSMPLAEAAQRWAQPLPALKCAFQNVVRMLAEGNPA